MTQQGRAGRRSHLLDVSPLRESRAFARLWVGNAVAATGGQLTVVAVGLHVYRLTGSTFAVSLVGVCALVPTIVAGLYGGVLADALDRRRVLLAAALLAWGSTVTIAVLAWTGRESVGSLYVLTALNATAATVIGATRNAVVPRLLPARLLAAAAALEGLAFGLAVSVGPALAGVLVAWAGFPIAYTLDAVLFVGAFLGILTLPPMRPEGEPATVGLRSVLDGLRFLGTAPNVRASFLADIAAMLFGQPRVLFPAAGALVLGGGPVTVGVLTAAGAVGATLSGVLSGRVTVQRRQGVGIVRAVQAYGLAVVGFGVVLALAALGRHGEPPASAADPAPAHLLWVGLAALLLAAAGAADNVSVIFRQAVLQAAVPDAMRGRLQGIFMVVVTGGPRLGDVWSGALAGVVALWFPPLLGGLVIVGVLAAMLRLQPGFAAYDAAHPTP